MTMTDATSTNADLYHPQIFRNVQSMFLGLTWFPRDYIRLAMSCKMFLAEASVADREWRQIMQEDFEEYFKDERSDSLDIILRNLLNKSSSTSSSNTFCLWAFVYRRFNLLSQRCHLFDRWGSPCNMYKTSKPNGLELPARSLMFKVSKSDVALCSILGSFSKNGSIREDDYCSVGLKLGQCHVTVPLSVPQSSLTDRFKTKWPGKLEHTLLQEILETGYCVYKNQSYAGLDSSYASSEMVAIRFECRGEPHCVMMQSYQDDRDSHYESFLVDFAKETLKYAGLDELRNKLGATDIPEDAWKYFFMVLIAGYENYD
eukprot:TRINITY_DN2445_c0_g1_i2.p1 TRINITY_DN2445_c0_g1~~TRINITY_DN2445_c0_g1_i2.p1  ORF type:complete len:347 (-),score=31.02 TRINITY_DN2445_c0_g1_i2:107-1054(-)